MNVIHVPFGFHPDAVGGTEVYVEGLARALNERGVRSAVVAPGSCDAAYAYRDLAVRRFAVSPTVGDVSELYGIGDQRAASAVGAVLDQERPDVVHLHAFTRAVSVLTVREARRRGIPVVFTYHTPTVSCPRGTLLRWGRELCDGHLRVRRCAGCALHARGLGRPISLAVAALPAAAGRLVAAAGLQGRLWTAARMTELVAMRHRAFAQLMTEADHIVALATWTKQLLVLNGVAPSKITLSRHGIPDHLLAPTVPRRRSGERDRLRIAFLGRLDRTKGVDVLVKAVRSIPDVPLQLDIYGIVVDDDASGYVRALAELAKGDSRIALEPPVSHEQVVPLLARYDVLAVPSQWFETGPLVILEAFAAGVAVIGARVSGIEELVEDGVNGVLVEPISPRAWSKGIRRLYEDPGFLDKLAAGVRKPRGMNDVARDMVGVYRDVISRKHAAA